MNNRLSYECIELSYECTELSYEYCFEQLGEQRISHSNCKTSSENSTGYEQAALSFMPEAHTKLCHSLHCLSFIYCSLRENVHPDGATANRQCSSLGNQDPCIQSCILTSTFCTFLEGSVIEPNFNMFTHTSRLC